MADPHHADVHDDYARGSQEIGEQEATFSLFMGMAKWGSLALAATLAFLTLWFMPGGGFLGALIVAVVMVVAGWWFLRSKPQAH